MNKFERIAYDADPERCQSGSGHCPFKGVILPNGERSKFCPRHGGNKQIIAQEKQDQRTYLVAKWQDRIREKANSPKLKTLNEEIGILRLTLESKLERCNDDQELLLQSQSITTLVREIKDTLTAANKLDLSMGRMLDKNQAVQFVGNLIEIISNYIEDAEILKMISEDMIEQYESMTNGRAIVV